MRCVSSSGPSDRARSRPRGPPTLRATVVFVFRVELPPTRVYEDNAAVARIFKRRSVGGRMRHIRVNISFTLDAIDADQMTLGGAPSQGTRTLFPSLSLTTIT